MESRAGFQPAGNRYLIGSSKVADTNVGNAKPSASPSQLRSPVKLGARNAVATVAGKGDFAAVLPALSRDGKPSGESGQVRRARGETLAVQGLELGDCQQASFNVTHRV
jgi:hypothetical protein